ncbi:MAG TPA: Holliday junction resolvase RuvX [Candidatus Nitrosotenuis sp.]|nr:Holliday junction resolvase RuvX [Candidatus Nitrosotenuis sp.]
MKVLGVDPGRRRVGVALSAGHLARPLTTLEGRDRDRLVAELARLAAEHQVEAIVVGLPRNMDGTLGPAARAAQDLAARLEARCGLPVHLEDERLSTVEAEEALRRSGARRKRRQDKALRDRVAAALILQAWLDRQGQGGRNPPSAGGPGDRV